MMEELLELTRENNRMLKRIVRYIDMVESPQYRDEEDKKQFFFNLLANVASEHRGQNNNEPDQNYFFNR